MTRAAAPFAAPDDGAEKVAADPQALPADPAAIIAIALGTRSQPAAGGDATLEHEYDAGSAPEGDSDTG